MNSPLVLCVPEEKAGADREGQRKGAQYVGNAPVHAPNIPFRARPVMADRWQAKLSHPIVMVEAEKAPAQIRTVSLFDLRGGLFWSDSILIVGLQEGGTRGALNATDG
jgi:hypothetical protein